MKFGVFLPTANNGYIYSLNSPQYMPTFELNRQICVDAENNGFDFALSMVKYRGYGGVTGFWDYAVESTAIMATLVEATTTLKLWASIGVPSSHPAMAARLSATIDDASNGRFGVNIVGGWNKYEYAQMGLWPSDTYYQDRYRYSAEFIEIMRGLWAKGRLTHHGEFFDLEDCVVQPTPKHEVTVIVAGQSKSSLALAAAQADVNFILGTPEECKAARDGLDEALAVTGRECESAVLLGIIAAETDEEAIAQAVYYMEGVDVATQEGLLKAASNDTTGSAVNNNLQRQSSQVLDIVFEHEDRAAFLQGSCWYSPHIVGSYAKIAAYLDALETESNCTSVVLTFPDYTTDLVRFAENVMPLMTTYKPTVLAG